MTGTPYEEVQLDSPAEWRSWLATHHDDSSGIRLVTWKKGHGPQLPYDDIVDIALCFGWVDSQPRSVDAHRSSRLLTPRRARSSWSRINKERVRRLQGAGLMAPAGLAVVRAARQDGSWTALDAVENLEEPEDLAASLDAVPTARRNWDAFPPSTKRAILEWINTAKTTATRTKRVEETVTDAANGRRANQWRQPKI